MSPQPRTPTQRPPAPRRATSPLHRPPVIPPRPTRLIHPRPRQHRQRLRHPTPHPPTHHQHPIRDLNHKPIATQRRTPPRRRHTPTKLPHQPLELHTRSPPRQPRPHPLLKPQRRMHRHPHPHDNRPAARLNANARATPESTGGDGGAGLTRSTERTGSGPDDLPRGDPSASPATAPPEDSAAAADGDSDDRPRSLTRPADTSRATNAAPVTAACLNNAPVSTPTLTAAASTAANSAGDNHNVTRRRRRSPPAELTPEHPQPKPEPPCPTSCTARQRTPQHKPESQSRDGVPRASGGGGGSRFQGPAGGHAAPLELHVSGSARRMSTRANPHDLTPMRPRMRPATPDHTPQPGPSRPPQTPAVRS